MARHRYGALASGDLRAMPQYIAYTSPENEPPAMPLVRLTLRGAKENEEHLEFRQDAVLIGAAAEYDLRLPSESASPLIAIATVVPEGLKIRRLNNSNSHSQREMILRVHDECALGAYHLRLEFLADNTLRAVRKVLPASAAGIATLKEQL